MGRRKKRILQLFGGGLFLACLIEGFSANATQFCVCFLVEISDSTHSKNNATNYLQKETAADDRG